MKNNSPKVTISLLLHNSEKHIGKTLYYLKNQTYQNYELVTLDNASTDNSIRILKKYFPHCRIISKPTNVGFAQGNNEIIKNSTAPYVFLLNDDVFLKQNYLEKLVTLIESDTKIGSASGFLYRAENSKETDIADGIELLPHKNLRFTTRNEGVKIGKLETSPFEVWGVSAPAAIYRTSALQDVAISKDDFFDSDFFIYKEDVDLAWRLRNMGWKSFVEPTAIGYHNRGLRGHSTANDIANAGMHLKRDFKQNYFSMRNHILLRYKNLSPTLRKKYFFHIYWFEIKKLFFYTIFRPSVLRAFLDAKKMKSKMLEKQKKMRQNTTNTSVESLDKWITN